MNKKSYLLLLAAWLFTSQAQAQDQAAPPLYSSTQKKYTVAIQPFQWINLGWRFDFEMRLGDGPGWLQFGPTVYSASGNGGSYHYKGHSYDGIPYGYGIYDDCSGFRESFSELRGGGLDINYKRFFDPKRSLYFASGLSYSRFDIDYYGEYGRWKDYTEDGLQYHEYTYSLGLHTQHIDRMAINCYLGYQVPSRRMFLFDMFFGFSYRHSISEKDKPAFDKSVWSYGYTGFVFMTGLRFGIGIR